MQTGGRHANFCLYYKQTPGAEEVKGGLLLLVSFAQSRTCHRAVGLGPMSRHCAGCYSTASCSEFPFPKALQPVLAVGRLPGICASPLQSLIFLALREEQSSNVLSPLAVYQAVESWTRLLRYSYMIGSYCWSSEVLGAALFCSLWTVLEGITMHLAICKKLLQTNKSFNNT